jgi:hypothetical protein
LLPSRQEEEESDSTEYLVAQFQYANPTIPIHVPRRNLKTREDGTRKTVELSKAVISLKIPNTLAKLSSKTPVEQQDRDDRAVCARR